MIVLAVRHDSRHRVRDYRSACRLVRKFRLTAAVEFIRNDVVTYAVCFFDGCKGSMCALKDR
jgi:hypothetical protein